MVDYGVSSMVEPLREVLVQSPDDAFGRAFDDPANGYRQKVDLELAKKEHQIFAELLSDLDANVNFVADDSVGPDFIYQYDPSLVTRRGAILLRSGKPTRRGEESAHAKWYEANGVPVVGGIESPGTVDGGDVLWLDSDTIAVGRTLRSNQSGITQLKGFLEESVHVFDMPYDAGPDECLHLMSVISPVAADLAVVEMARLPVGLFALCKEMGIRLIDIPEEEVASLGCNVLAVRPGVVVMLEGNPVTRSRLEAVGVEVHTFEGREICLNGSGGPTCLTRPIFRG